MRKSRVVVLVDQRGERDHAGHIRRLALFGLALFGHYGPCRQGAPATEQCAPPQIHLSTVPGTAQWHSTMRSVYALICTSKAKGKFVLSQRHDLIAESRRACLIGQVGTSEWCFCAGGSTVIVFTSVYTYPL